MGQGCHRRQALVKGLGRVLPARILPARILPVCILAGRILTGRILTGRILAGRIFGPPGRFFLPVKSIKQKVAALKSQLASLAGQASGHGADTALQSKVNALEAQIATLEAQLAESGQALSPVDSNWYQLYTSTLGIAAAIPLIFIYVQTPCMRHALHAKERFCHEIVKGNPDRKKYSDCLCR